MTNQKRGDIDVMEAFDTIDHEIILRKLLCPYHATAVLDFKRG